MLNKMFRERVIQRLLCMLICFLCTSGVDCVTNQVLEGNTITLNTGLRGIQNDAQILWFYGPRSADGKIVNSLVINGKTVTEINDRFKDRTQLDRTSGSLTIRNISRDDSGVYKLQVITTSLSDYSARIIVYAPVSKPVIGTQKEHQSESQEHEGNKPCSAVCTVENGDNVSLSWYRGKERISTISNSFDLTALLMLKIQYSHNYTYTCVAANLVNNQTTQFNIAEVCGIKPGCSSCWGINKTLAVVLTPVCLIILLLVFLGYFFGKTESQVTENVKLVYSEVPSSTVINVEEIDISTVLYSGVRYTKMLKQTN